MRILISFCEELETMVVRELRRAGHAVMFPGRRFGNSWYSQRDAQKPNIIITDDRDKFGRYDEDSVPLLKVIRIDDLAAAVAVGKSLLRRVRSVGRPEVTFFAPEFRCYLDCSSDSLKDRGVRRNDLVQELAVLAMLIKGATARLRSAKSYLAEIEGHFERDLEDIMYRLSTGSWKAYHLRVWIMYCCAFFAYFVPGVEVGHFPKLSGLEYKSRYIYWDLPFAMTYPAHCLMEGWLNPFVGNCLQETLAFAHTKAASRRG